MNRYWIGVMALCVSIGVGGMSSPLEASKVCPINSSAPSGQQTGKVNVAYEQSKQTIRSKEGVTLLEVTQNKPIVTIEAYPKAMCKIQKVYDAKQRAFKREITKYTKMASEDYKSRTQEQKEYWNGYGLGVEYASGRVDDQVMSIIQTNYEFTGGAHPNSSRIAQNFDTKTGKRLTLKDITKDPQQAKEKIDQFILKETQKEQYKGAFFPDYEASISQILTEDTWYFSDEGIVIISNEYIISPHATGILEFTIPYSELTFVKPVYMPAK